MLRNPSSKRAVWIGVALVGLVGALAAWLVAAGNPGNMGVCGACFLRDVGGSLGLFSSGPQYFRPEVAGLMLGAFAAVLARGRFSARSGSHAAARFFFGLWMAIGALGFLGCPFRLFQRLGGGDSNALVGAGGLALGVGLGLLFERRGYGVGKTAEVPKPVGLLAHVFVLTLLVLFLRGVLLGPSRARCGALRSASGSWRAPRCRSRDSAASTRCANCSAVRAGCCSARWRWWGSTRWSRAQPASSTSASRASPSRTRITCGTRSA
ncbi:MAG: hypothetical protein HOP15_07530 [Planctomycetes bacterium]|nr:hypothetical protein [Planctomycetota bacterium]